MRTLLQQFFFLFILFTPVFPVIAAGPTGEESALDYLNKTRLPLELSRDGNWLVYLDSDAVLHRMHIRDAMQHQQIQLPQSVDALSVTKTAQKVALPGCAGIVDFSSRKPSILQLQKACKGGDELRISRVAISSDATRIARQDHEGHLWIIDAATQNPLFEIPLELDGRSSGAPVLHLSFVDQNRKLLVVQAVQGEMYESAPRDSDMLFAVWDLEKRELFSFFHADSGTLHTEDYLWSFSEASGDLWALQTGSEYWNPEKARGSFDLLNYNLKQCDPEKKSTIKGTRRHILELSADPHGRWIATLEVDELASEFNSASQAKPVLVIRDSRTGKILRSTKLAKSVRSLAWLPQGDALLGVEGMEMMTLPEGWTQIKPGSGVNLFRQTIPLPNNSSTAAKSLPWKAQRCPVEDETPQARMIQMSKQQPVKLAEINLKAPRNEEVESPCPSHSFGLSKSGSLWIDRNRSHIEEIDPLTGRKTGELAVPRNANTCSLPLYEREQFLNLQGDTVTLRPFSAKGAGKNRRVLARKPGWTGRALLLQHGSWFSVFWVRIGAEGDYTGVLYALDTGKLIEEFDWDAEEPELPSRPEMQAGEYRWDISYFSSIRAQYRPKLGGGIVTVLWDGLKPGRIACHDEPCHVPRLVDFGRGKAAAIWSDRLVLYDAAARQILADLPLKAINAQWSEGKRLLFVETYDKNKSTEDSSWLQVYRIE